MMNKLQARFQRALLRYLEHSQFWRLLFARLAVNDTVVQAKIYPYAQGDEAWWTEHNPPNAPDLTPETLPVPPPDLWEGYGATPKDYLESGRIQTERMLKILSSACFDITRAEKVLDFGCAAGRMLRWLGLYAGNSEYWGVDLSAKSIHWAVQHLSPPFLFFNNVTAPPLPFPADIFDLIYCGSVFSHISDLADLWLLELRRVLKPGALLYATVQDKHSAEAILDPASPTRLSRTMREAGERTGCFRANYAKLVVGRSPKTTMVFYDINHLAARWGRFFEIVSIVPDAYGFQTAVVLRKR